MKNIFLLKPLIHFPSLPLPPTLGSQKIPEPHPKLSPTNPSTQGGLHGMKRKGEKLHSKKKCLKLSHLKFRNEFKLSKNLSGLK